MEKVKNKIDDEQVLTEEQRVRFSALLLEKYHIKIDTENELLPFYFIGYHSAIINDKNNKTLYNNLQKMFVELDKRHEQRSQTLEESLNDRHKAIDDLVDGFRIKVGEESSKLNSIVNDFDKQMSDQLSQFKAIQYHFTDSGQAFWFSFGRIGLPIVVALLLLFLGLL